MRRASFVTAAVGVSLVFVANNSQPASSLAGSTKTATLDAARGPAGSQAGAASTTGGWALLRRQPNAPAPGPGSTPPPTTSTSTTSTTSTTTTTTSPAPTNGTCGGQQTLTVDGSTWRCTFDSEFTGSSINPAQWRTITTAESGFVNGATACYVDSPNNYSVGNGYLTLTARKEAAPFWCSMPNGGFETQYTSATLATYGLFSQAYGRFEIDAKVSPTSVPGLQSSFWLYPQNETAYGAWPASGEIDVAETYSQYPNIAIPYIHYLYDTGTTNAATKTNTVTAYTCSINVGQFNDYVLEWTPTTLTMIYNGKTCLVDHWIPASPEAAPEPFNQPFFINLTQALGVGTNNFDPNTTPMPATTEVKFVRVWQAAS